MTTFLNTAAARAFAKLSAEIQAEVTTFPVAMSYFTAAQFASLRDLPRAAQRKHRIETYLEVRSTRIAVQHARAMGESIGSNLR